MNAKFEPDGSSRFETLFTVDARVEKAFIVRQVRTILSLDVFNVTNANTVLSREGRQNVSSANRVFEIVAPRVVRVGLRVNF